MEFEQDLPWIIEMDILGSFAELDELKSLHDSIPEAEKKHPLAIWLEAWIQSRFVSEEMAFLA